MTLVEFLVLLVIAGICGAIGEAIGGYARGGFVVSVAIGFIGALFGLFIARGMKLPELYSVHLGNVSFPIIWSIIGAAVFMALINLVSRRGFANR